MEFHAIFKRIMSALMGHDNDTIRQRLAATWTNELLSHAVRRGASRIRIEPGDDRVLVQFHIGQRLVNGPGLDRTLVPYVAKHLKRLVSLDDANVVRRQIGSVVITIARKRMRIKVTTQPLSHAEHLAIYFDEP
ncbi:MAG TPA: ATPase, T2SS/T4P/T4SS family [Candidatus Methylomirabilis sp.]|nr:ATPase, T2SS/T4P/T4SS family [Candidatus Methylomirabilis sp.]